MSDPWKFGRSRPELDALIERSKATVARMTPAERAAMHEAQRQSWVRGELGMGSDADEERWKSDHGI